MPKKVAHRPTTVPPSVELFKDVMMDETFNATPEKIYNLMFTSEQFMRDFWANNQKLTGKPHQYNHASVCSYFTVL